MSSESGSLMPLAPIWRTRLFALAGAALAVALGVEVAHESFFWPAVGLGSLAAIVLIRAQPLPLPTLLLGGAMLGYIVGNRGFAQLSLTSGFPLLPAEFVLLVGGAILAVQCAWRRELPVRGDALNIALLLWMAYGTGRLLFGLRAHGFAAVRDYALVYYGAFFFLAQHAAREPAGARFLQRTVLAACGVLLVVHPLVTQFPAFFAGSLTLRGTPLIFFKDDLAGNFMSVGALLCFLRFEEKRRTAWLVGSLALAGLMLTTNSRSSMLGLALGALWLGLAGRWRFAGTLAVAAVVAAVAIFAVAEVRNESWRQTPLHRIYERVASIADPFGQRAYATEDAFKGDNNVFRMVWWRTAVEETLETNRWFGLGFGHDLAARFVREYLPEASEEFSARSPHNVLITVFARMGLVGAGLFLAMIAALTVRLWRTLRQPEHIFTTGACGLAAWVLLACAGFGVVLEGPMGAVVFWTLLGLAQPRPEEAEESGENSDRLLPEAAAAREVTPTSVP